MRAKKCSPQMTFTLAGQCKTTYCRYYKSPGAKLACLQSRSFTYNINNIWCIIKWKVCHRWPQTYQMTVLHERHCAKGAQYEGLSEIRRKCVSVLLRSPSVIQTAILSLWVFCIFCMQYFGAYLFSSALWGGHWNCLQCTYSNNRWQGSN